MTHKTAAWYDYLTGRKLGLWVYDNWMGGKLLNSAIANNDPPVGKARVLQERLNKGLLLTGAVKENVINPTKDWAKGVGSYLYNTGFTGRWAQSLADAYTYSDAADKQLHDSMLYNAKVNTAKQLQDLYAKKQRHTDTLAKYNLKLRNLDALSYASQLTLLLEHLKVLGYNHTGNPDDLSRFIRESQVRRDAAESLFNKFRAQQRGSIAINLTAAWNAPLLSGPYTLWSYMGGRTPRNIRDPRNYVDMIKNIPQEQKLILKLQNIHGTYTSAANLLIPQLITGQLLGRANAALTPATAGALGRVGNAYRMPWLRYAAPAATTTGTTITSAYTQGLVQTWLANGQAKHNAGYGDPASVLAWVPGALANFSEFARLMDQQNRAFQDTQTALLLPDSLLDAYAAALRNPQLQIPSPAAVRDAAGTAAFVQSVPGLNTIDDILNAAQLAAPAVPPKHRATVNSLDPTSILHHTLTLHGKDNSAAANDFNTLIAGKWIADAYRHDFPSRNAQQGFNQLLQQARRPRAGYDFASDIISSSINGIPLPKLPAPNMLWDNETGQAKSPQAFTQLRSVVLAYIGNRPDSFGDLKLTPGASNDPTLIKLKKYYIDSMEQFIHSVPDKRYVMLALRSALMQDPNWRALTPLLQSKQIAALQSRLGVPPDTGFGL